MRQTDFVILGLLSEAPLTGYQIKKVVDIRFKFFWSESFGQIFPALKSLCAKNFIEEKTVEEKPKRSQKTYNITEDGMAALREWLCLPVERESLRLEILVKMYFSHLVDAKVMLDHVDQFRKAHVQELQILNLFENELKSIIHQDENHPHILRVIDFGQKVNKAYLNWSLETIQFLEGVEQNETKNS